MLAGLEFYVNMAAELALRDKTLFCLEFEVAYAAVYLHGNYNAARNQSAICQFRSTRHNCFNCGSSAHVLARGNVPYCNR